MARSIRQRQIGMEYLRLSLRKDIKKLKNGKTYRVSISYLKDTIKKRIKVRA